MQVRNLSEPSATNTKAKVLIDIPSTRRASRTGDHQSSESPVEYADIYLSTEETIGDDNTDR